MEEFKRKRSKSLIPLHFSMIIGLTLLFVFIYLGISAIFLVITFTNGQDYIKVPYIASIVTRSYSFVKDGYTGYFQGISTIFESIQTYSYLQILIFVQRLLWEN